MGMRQGRGRSGAERVTREGRVEVTIRNVEVAKAIRALAPVEEEKRE